MTRKYGGNLMRFHRSSNMFRFALAIFFLLGSGVATSAQNSESYRRISNWLGLYEQVYQQYLSIYSQTGQVDEVSYSLVDGDVTKAFAQRQGLSLLTSAKLALQVAEDAYFALPEIPLIQDESLDRLLPIRLALLSDMRGQVSAALELTQELFAAALRGDADIAAQLSAKQMNQYIGILRFENVAYNSQLTVMDPDNPAYSLLSVALRTNEAIIRYGTFFADFYHGVVDDEDRERAMAQSENRLLDSNREIVNGRLSVKRWERNLRRMSVANEDDRINREVGLRMLLAMMDAFDVEADITAAVQGLIDLTLTGKPLSDDQIDETISLLDIRLQTLIAQRLSLQRERSAMVGELR